MNITHDANLLVRAIIDDDPRQSPAARAILSEANTLSISTLSLCELTWVLRRGYRNSAADVARAIRQIAATGNAVMDQPAIRAGLAMLDAGGDFADGVIAYEGRRQGANCFVSFNVDAIRLSLEQGVSARLP